MPDVIGKVMSLLSGDGDGGSDTDILLKQLLKEFAQNKYAKFYRTKQSEIDPSLGQYIFSLYKTIYPLQIFLRDTANLTKIKHVALEAFLEKDVLAIIKELNPEAIAERKKTAGPDFPKQLEETLASLVAGFDNPRVNAADKCYNLIASMKQFVFFDFCSLLRKFDPEIKEGDFLSQPKFAPLEGDIIVPDLAALLSVLPSYEADDDWKMVFEILKYCKGGTEVIPFAQWNNLLISVNDIRKSKVLEYIGRLSSGNPIWEVKPLVPHETLSGSWLEEKSREVREVIADIAGSQRDAQVRALENAVFGTNETIKLSFYIPEKGKVLLDKNLDGYTYARALNHLYLFIQEYLTKEVHELCDILLIRGQWTNNNASRLMSDGYHDVSDIIGEIKKLDASLDDDGSNGPRLKAALLRVDRDKNQARYITGIIDSINEEALELINRSVPSLIVVGKHLKMLLDDYDKKPYELMMNWKELITFSKLPLSQRMAAAYKKINYFVQLMILETRPVEEE